MSSTMLAGEPASSNARSASAAASARSWVTVMSVALRPRASRRTSWRNPARVSGSRAENGSSSSRMRGSLASARAAPRVAVVRLKARLAAQRRGRQDRFVRATRSLCASTRSGRAGHRRRNAAATERFRLPSPTAAARAVGTSARPHAQGRSPRRRRSKYDRSEVAVVRR